MSEANILLVDDEPGMLRYIRTLLEVDDYKVETATTGEGRCRKVRSPIWCCSTSSCPALTGWRPSSNSANSSPD